jgi:asparagine synthase (glutamine-hydrolysing)
MTPAAAEKYRIQILMCGIAGFWQTRRSPEVPAEILAQMGLALQHRGPDDSGVWFDNTSGIGLVHRRLAVVDLSAAGHQPMTSGSGRYTITFNGEIYNFEEIRGELGPGHNWKGHSDTEVLLAAVERWGLEAAVGRFVGMFAFALWDRRESKLDLVRDRLGIKPVYYGWVGGDFVFASELKAICQYPGFDGAIDCDTLALYMRHNYVPAPHCIYQGMHKLQPGSVLTLASAAGPAEARVFWSATRVARAGFASRISGSDREVTEKLAEKLARAVSMRMIADVPLGAFLSGGIDSSIVVALMQAQSRRPVRTFTIGFHEKDFDEAAHARRIAAHLGTDHTELYVTAREALDEVPQLPTMFDEPFADSSQIPTFLISKLARKSVTVSLSGDGGDELFGGYNRYLLTKRIWQSLRHIPNPVRRMVANIILYLPPETIDRLYRGVRPLIRPRKRSAAVGDKAHKFAGLLELQDPPAIYMHVLSHWDNPAVVVRGAREPDTVAHFVEQAMALPSVEEAMMLTDLAHYLPDDILTKVDRASMAVNLEARVPLLDHTVVEFAWKLPLHFKIRGGVGKWILRQVLHQYVPASLVDRPKMGFGVPIAGWLRGPLREWAEDLLSPEALRSHGFFESDIIRRRWREHLSGVRNWQYHLWDVLVFQDWFFHQASARHRAKSVLAAAASAEPFAAS